MSHCSQRPACPNACQCGIDVREEIAAGMTDGEATT